MKKNEAIIQALLESDSFTDAARRAGVARSTIQKRLQDPAFRAKLREARSVAFAHAITRLAALASEAVAVLAKGVRGEEISKGRFLCAKTVLEQCHAMKAEDLEDRMTEMENRIAQVLNETEIGTT